MPNLNYKIVTWMLHENVRCFERSGLLERLPVVIITKFLLLKKPLNSPGQDRPPLSTLDGTYPSYDFLSELSVSPTEMLNTQP